MLRARVFSIARLLAVVAIFLVPAMPANGAKHSKVMLVLDASGSMWGQIKGTPKIVIARRAVRDLLSRWDRSIQLGLSVYGHRRKGDCGDIETIYPVGPARPQAILKAVDALTPKGKTPLSEAVRRAAGKLKFTEEEATVILISDGKETCQADPCALGRELEQLGVGFTVHVIGFDVAKQEQAGLRCLAENTGGLFLAAENASELNAALSKAVSAIKAPPKKVVQAAPPPKKKAVVPGHRFSAVLSEGDDPITRGMRWDVYEAAQNADGKRKQIAGSYNAQPSFVLQPGRYVVVAKYGSARVSMEFDVASPAEAKRHELVLNAGLLALKATFTDGGEAISRGMRWDVYLPQPDADGKRRRIIGNYDATPLFKLPAGRFFVVAKTGNAVISGEVEIKAGERTQRTFVMKTGIAVFEASYSEGGTVITKGMRWDVYGAEKDLDGKRRRIVGNYDAKPNFRLPAGRYYVVARRGSAVRAREIEVTAGKRTDIKFVLNAGLLALSAVLSGEKEPIKKGMRWDVYSIEKDLDGKRRRYAGNYEATPTFTFAEGKYYVVAKAGQAVKSAEVSVTANKRSDIVIDLNAGMVKLVAKAGDGAQVTKGLRWDVFSYEKDLEGKRRHFVGGYVAAPIYTLSAGDYLIVVKTGNTSKEQKLTVKPGDSRQVEVAL